MSYFGYAVIAIAAVIIIACIIGAIQGAKEKDREKVTPCIMFSIVIALGVVMIKTVFPNLW